MDMLNLDSVFRIEPAVEPAMEILIRLSRDVLKSKHETAKFLRYLDYGEAADYIDELWSMEWYDFIANHIAVYEGDQ